jgi:hypothetical protein
MISVWSRSAKLLTRYEARRIAANHRQLAELPRQKALYRTEMYLTYGATIKPGHEEAVCMRTVYEHRPSLPFVAGQEPAGIVAEHQKSMYFATTTRLSTQRRDFVFARVTIARRAWVSYFPSGRWLRCRTDYPGSRHGAWTCRDPNKPIQVGDVEADPEYNLREGQRLRGFVRPWYPADEVCRLAQQC